MRLGRVQINVGYVVNLDNQDMVDHAKQALVQDITDACIKNTRESIDTWISIDNDSGRYREEDIQTILREDHMNEDEEEGETEVEEAQAP